MKQLADNTDFGRIPPLEFKNGRSRVYHRSARKEVRKYPLALGKTITEPLYAAIVYDGYFLPGYHYLRKHSPVFSLEYVREGALLARQNEHAWRVEAGEIFLMQPERECEIAIPRGEFCIKTSIAIQGSLLPHLLSLTGLAEKEVLPHPDREEIDEILHEFEALSGKTDATSEQRNGLLSYALLQRLRDGPHVERSISPELAALAERLERECADEWPLEKLAKLAGCSGAWLIRRFRDAFGATPRQLLIRFRMERAARLLLGREELSVKEISGLCGYENALNFSTEFRKRHGLSPRNFRAHAGF